MKQLNLLLSIAVLTIFIASCSMGRYSHLSKVKVKNESDKMGKVAKKSENASNSDEDNIESLNQPENAYADNNASPGLSLNQESKPSINQSNANAESPKKESIENSKSFKENLKDKAKFLTSNSKSKANEDLKVDAFALVGFISGVVGLLIFPFFLGTVAVVFSAIGLSRISKGKSRGKGFAIAGLVLGIISVVWALIVLSA